MYLPGSGLFDLRWGISRRTYKLVSGYPFLSDVSNSVSLSSLLSALENIRSAREVRHDRMLVQIENSKRSEEDVDEGGDRTRIESEESE